MPQRSKSAIMLALSVVILSLVLAFIVYGEAKPTTEPVLATSIGTVDLAEIKDKMADYVQLTTLKEKYDAELAAFAAERRKEAAAYYGSLETKKDQQMAGKSEAEKQAIEREYDKLAQDKASEVNKTIQAKMTELQQRLDADIDKADERLRQVIATVATEKKLKLVIVESGIYEGGIDVTAEVLAKAAQPAKGGK